MLQMEIVPCRCGGVQMRLKCSRTEANKDRWFYACPSSKYDGNRKDRGCRFFFWQDKLMQCPCGKGPCEYVDLDPPAYYKCSRLGTENCGYNTKKESPSSSSLPASSIGSSASYGNPVCVRIKGPSISGSSAVENPLLSEQLKSLTLTNKMLKAHNLFFKSPVKFP